MPRAHQKPKKTNNPEVVLDVIWRDGLLAFLLANQGTRPVRDVRVAFRRKVFGLGGAVEISDLPIWSKLSFLPAGKEIEVPIDRAPVFLAQDRGTPLVVTIQYQDADGIRWVAAITHDFGAYAAFPEIRVR